LALPLANKAMAMALPFPFAKPQVQKLAQRKIGKHSAYVITKTLIYIYLIPGLSRHVFLCSNPWGMHVRGRPCSQMVFLTCNTGYKLCNQDSIRPIGLPPVTTSEPNGSSTSDTV
jgi:hypothetical protein